MTITLYERYKFAGSTNMKETTFQYAYIKAK